MKVYRGDEFIAGNNFRYQVTHVDGDIAYCRSVGVEEMPGAVFLKEDDAVSAAAGVSPAKKPLVIGIYHTHGDESYVPSQGTESIPEGKGSGVGEVARELESKLKTMGIKAIFDDTPHTPHDAGAYNRSRRTAYGLVKQGAGTIIDVHRDAAPAYTYLTSVGEKSIAKLRLVVGKHNPQAETNLGFAKTIKSHLDTRYPDLTKGIFIGQGVFNQDTLPTAVLVEVGSQWTTLEEAKTGVDLFAESIPDIFAVSSKGTIKVRPGADQGGSWKSIGLILGVLIVGGFGYLLISTGGWKGAMGKLRQFGGQEWSSFLGNNTDKENKDKRREDIYKK